MKKVSKMTLIQTMRTQFKALDPDTSLDVAAKEMALSGQCLLPVCIGSRLVGSLLLQDLVFDCFSDQGPGLDEARARDRTVADVMKRDPLSCGMETSLEDVRSLIFSRRQPAVCVTSSEGDLVGMIDAFEVVDSLSVPQSFSGPEPDEVHQIRGDT
ncbi:CBS domain containing protein [Thiorhodococcus drewsii AZ1]|uniref:CBS domain containing protein n=2 Tax=Thiorhodococcus drewsii TaxID=210408 RepID=G2E2K3_9GAMM|nr:CBS domain containing protein [Thiorhodococcus drewsii AZ1]